MPEKFSEFTDAVSLSGFKVVGTQAGDNRKADKTLFDDLIADAITNFANDASFGSITIPGITDSVLGTDSDGIIVPVTTMPILQRVQAGATYTIQASDKGYIIYFSEECEVTIPDTLPAGFEFGAVYAEGGGPVTFVEGGTTVFHTTGTPILSQENSAAHWIAQDTNDWYGYGPFGSGDGLQEVINTNPLLTEASFIEIDAPFNNTSDAIFSIEYDDGTYKQGFYMFELLGTYFYPAMVSGDFVNPGNPCRYVYIDDALVNFGAIDGLGDGSGVSVRTEEVHILSSFNNVDIYMGDTSPNGINGIDMYADEVAISGSVIALATPDTATSTNGINIDSNTEEINIYTGSVYIQMLGSGAGQLNIQSDISIFSGTVRGNGSTASTALSGTIYKNDSPNGNIGTGEDVLKTYPLPAGALAENLQNVSLTAAGTFANTANNKRIRLKFGSDTIFDSGSLAITTASDWILSSEIIRTSATAQKCITKLTTSSSVLVSTCDYTTAAQTLSGAVTISITGEATADNDVVAEMIIIRFEP